MIVAEWKLATVCRQEPSEETWCWHWCIKLCMARWQCHSLKFTPKDKRIRTNHRHIYTRTNHKHTYRHLPTRTIRQDTSSQSGRSLTGTPFLLSHMKTSSNGNIFCVTGSLCGEFAGHRWIPFTKASDAELWCFLWSAPEWMVEWTTMRLVIWNIIALIMTSL